MRGKRGVNDEGLDAGQMVENGPDRFLGAHGILAAGTQKHRRAKLVNKSDRIEMIECLQGPCVQSPVPFQQRFHQSTRDKGRAAHVAEKWQVSGDGLDTWVESSNGGNNAAALAGSHRSNSGRVDVRP
jgi:hypothetical protein